MVHLLSVCTAWDRAGLLVLVTVQGDHCLCQAPLNNSIKLRPLSLETKGKGTKDVPETYFVYVLNSCMFCFLRVPRLPFVGRLSPYSLGYSLIV